MLRDRAQNQPVGCFRHGVAQRAGQRANCVISNRLPRFRIKACSAVVRSETEHSERFFLLFSEEDYSSLIASKTVFRVASINCTESSRNHFPGNLYSELVQP